MFYWHIHKSPPYLKQPLLTGTRSDQNSRNCVCVLKQELTIKRWVSHNYSWNALPSILKNACSNDILIYKILKHLHTICDMREIRLFNIAHKIFFSCKINVCRDSLLVRAIDSWSKGSEFESRQERLENFLLRSSLCVLILIRCLLHPRVTAVARKRPRSFCQKCRWQVKN